MKNNKFLYQLGFALVNFAEATVSLACLGQYSPAWTMQFAARAAKRRAAVSLLRRLAVAEHIKKKSTIR